MPAKAVDAGGHRRVPAHCPVPPVSERFRREVDAWERFNRNCRFRGHGPLLQVAHPPPAI